MERIDVEPLRRKLREEAAPIIDVFSKRAKMLLQTNDDWMEVILRDGEIQALLLKIARVFEAYDTEADNVAGWKNRHKREIMRRFFEADNARWVLEKLFETLADVDYEAYDSPKERVGITVSLYNAIVPVLVEKMRAEGYLSAEEEGAETNGDADRV